MWSLSAGLDDGEPGPRASHFVMAVAKDSNASRSPDDVSRVPGPTGPYQRLKPLRLRSSEAASSVREPRPRAPLTRFEAHLHRGRYRRPDRSPFVHPSPELRTRLEQDNLRVSNPVRDAIRQQRRASCRASHRPHGCGPSPPPRGPHLRGAPAPQRTPREAPQRIARRGVSAESGRNGAEYDGSCVNQVANGGTWQGARTCVHCRVPLVR